MRRTFERLLVAFLIARLALAFISAADPTGGVLTDSRGYLALAHGLIENGRYGVQPDGEADLLRPPIYSGLLALVQITLGSETYILSLLQLMMSAWMSWLLVLLGRELAAPRAGLVAGWLCALSPNIALWSLTVMTEVSFALLLTLTTLFLVKAVKAARPGWPAVTGGMLGVLAYLRPIAITLMPVWAAVACWVKLETAGRRKAAAGAIAMIALGVIVILPWAYRNSVSYGKFTFSTATSKTLIAFNLAEVVAQAEGTNRNRAVSSLDPEKGLIGLTTEVFRRYPGVFVKAQAIGVARSLVGADIGTWGNVLGDDRWVGFGLLSGAFWGMLGEALADLSDPADPSFWPRSAILGYSLLFSVILIALAAVGTFAPRRRSLAERTFIHLAILSTAVLLLIPGAAGQARFRVPAEPFLALLAGYGAVDLGERLQAVRKRKRLVAGVQSATAPGTG